MSDSTLEPPFMSRPVNFCFSTKHDTNLCLCPQRDGIDTAARQQDTSQQKQQTTDNEIGEICGCMFYSVQTFELCQSDKIESPYLSSLICIRCK